MARPKKISTIDMSADPVEVVSNATPETTSAAVAINLQNAVPIEDTVSELTAEIVQPKVPEPEKAAVPKAICDIEELSESDKQILVEKRVKTILSQTQIPYIPALIRYKEPNTTAVPPMYALVDFDHRFVNEAWDFYRTNVKDPYVKDFLQLIANIFKPHRIYPRLVTFNYE